MTSGLNVEVEKSRPTGSECGTNTCQTPAIILDVGPKHVKSHISNTIINRAGQHSDNGVPCGVSGVTPRQDDAGTNIVAPPRNLGGGGGRFENPSLRGFEKSVGADLRTSLRVRSNCTADCGTAVFKDTFEGL